jgi:hypothetical protein
LIEEFEKHETQRYEPPNYFADAAEPNTAFRIHWRDVMEKTQGDPDYSRVDAMAALRMRVTGYSAGQICEAIKTNAPLMRKDVMSEREHDEKYRYRNWDRYAKETVEKYVFGPRGAVQYAKAEGYRPYYMKLEGRDHTGQRAEHPKQDLSR